MKKQLLSVCIGAAMVGALAPAHALESFNARTMGVADAGVAVTHFTHGALLNPANAARVSEKDDFNINLNAGGLLSDEDELIDGVDDLNTTFDDSTFDVLSVLDDPSDLKKVRNQIANIDEDRASISVGGNLTIGIPGKRVSGVFFVNVAGGFEVSPNVHDDDLAQLDAIITAAEAGSTDTSIDLDADNLKSEVTAIGMTVTEIGIAFGKEFTFDTINDYPVAIGITPKLQRVDTFVYSQRVNEADTDDFDADEYTTDDSAFNLDLGVSIHRDNWYLGLSGKNLIKQEYDTIDPNRVIAIEPQFTAGAGFDHQWGRVLLDLDLNPVEFVGSGVETQFVKFGAELNIYRHAQLRVGYRHDIEGLIEDTITVGFGLSPFEVVNLDLALMKGGDNTYGGALQLGLLF